MSRPILAIHISSDALCAVLLNAGLKSNVVEACARVALDHSRQESPFSAALAELKDHIQVADAAVVLSIPADQVIFRSLTVPFKDLKKIGQILPFELEPTLPVPVETLTVDFQAQVRDDLTEILAAAVDRQNIAQLIETFETAGLKPQLIVPGAYPLVHALWSSGQPLPEHYLWLDLDRDKATLLAMIQNKICMVRTLGLNSSSGECAQTLALKIQQTLTAITDLRSINYAPEQVYLSGTPVHRELDLRALSQALAIPVLPVDLRQLVTKVEIRAEVEGDGRWAFDAALALALVEADGNALFCFHRSGSALRSLWTSYKRYLKTPAILLALLAITGLGGVVLDNVMLQRRVDRIDEQTRAAFLSVFPDTSRIVDPVIQMQTKMDEFKKSSFDPTQTGEQVRCVDILYQISKSIPKETNVILNRMSVGSDGITIAGETAGFNTVDDVKNRLEKSELFSRVTIAAANMDKSGNKVLFRLKIDL